MAIFEQAVHQCNDKDTHFNTLFKSTRKVLSMLTEIFTLHDAELYDDVLLMGSLYAYRI